MKRHLPFWSMFALLLITIKTGAVENIIKPTKLNTSQYPSVERYILEQVREGDEMEAVSVVSAGFYDLGVKCQGARLYVLTFHDLKVKDRSGETIEASGGFTGSGGTTVVVFTISSDGKKIGELFNSVLLDFYGAVSRSDCADLSVQIRDIGKNGVMEVRGARLKFIKGRYVAEGRDKHK